MEYMVGYSSGFSNAHIPCEYTEPLQNLRSCAMQPVILSSSVSVFLKALKCSRTNEHKKKKFSRLKSLTTLKKKNSFTLPEGS